jgi:hypothetical protein
MNTEFWQAVVIEKQLREAKLQAGKRRITKKDRAQAESEFRVREWEIQSRDEPNFNRESWLATLTRAVTLKWGHQSLNIQKYLESTVVLLFDMSRADSPMDRTMAIVSFCQKHMEGPIFTKDNVQWSISKCADMVGGFLAMYDTIFGGMQVQSAEEHFAFFHRLLDSYEDIRDSPLVSKMHRFGMYALSLSLFTKLGLTFKALNYTKMEEAAIKRKFTLGPSFLHCLCDTLLFVCERGYQCMQSGSMDPIFHSGSSYEAWFTQVRELKQQSLYMSDPEALVELKKRGGSVAVIDRFEFLSKVDSLIEQGESILKFTKRLEKFELSLLNASMGDLQLMRANEITKRAAQKMRQAPFPLLVFGGSSVGKSTLIDLIFYQVGKTLALPTGSEFKYTRNFNDSFWSGFHPSMWFLILDDIAFMNPNKAPQGDPSLMEGIQILNRIPLVTNQAELADKGKCPFRGKCVVASTNTSKLNATSYYSCPLALKRRFPYMIDVTPKVAFQKDGQFMDSELVQEWKTSRGPQDVFDDIWDIKLFRLKPILRSPDGRDHREGQDGQYLRINADDEESDDFVFSDIYAFLAWVSKKAIAHQRNEDMMDRAGKEASDVKICPVCYYPDSRCSCMKVQAEDEVIDTDSESETEFWRRFDDAWQTRDETNPAEEFRRIEPTLSPLGLWLKSVQDSRRYYHDRFDMVKTMSTFYQAGREKVEDPVEPPSTRFAWAKACFMWPLYYTFMRWYSFRWIVMYVIFLFTGNRFGVGASLADKCFPAYVACVFHRMGRRVEKTFAMSREMKDLVKKVVVLSTVTFAVTALLTRLLLLIPGGRKKKSRQKRATAEHVSLNSQDEYVSDEEKSINRKVGPVRKKEPWLNLPPVQGGAESSASVGQKPVALSTERVNMWRKVDYQTTTFDVSPQTTSLKGKFDDFVNVVGRNCINFVCTDFGVERVRRRGKATCVCGHVYMTNEHCLPKTDTFRLSVTCDDRVCQGLDANISVLVSQSQVKRFPDRDIALFELNCLPPRKDLRPYFMKKGLEGSHNGILISRQLDGSFKKRPVKSMRRQFFRTPDIAPSTFWTGHLGCDEPTVVGDCGSLLVSNSSFGPILLGIHVAGEDSTVGSLMVDSEFLFDNTTRFTHPIIQSGEPMLSAPSAPRILNSTMHFKSPVTYIQEGKVAGVYGSFTGFRSAKRSAVGPTLFADEFAKHGYETKFGAPVMDSWEPWSVAITEMVNPVLDLNEGILKECADAFADEIISALGDDIKKIVHVLDMDTTVNGAPGVAYIDAMNRSTSAGCPWKKSKKSFMTKAEPRGDLQDPVDVSPEILERVEQMRQTYLRGERCMPVFCASLKDEALKFKKIDAKKTRVFTGSPMDFSLIMRQYLLCIARLFQNNRFVCESAPGTNPHSKEWQEIREYLTEFGVDRLIAGDYAMFDKRMSAIVILLAFHVIQKIAAASGNFSPEDLLVIAGIAEDIAFPLIDFNGDLIEFLGSNPSGQILTVIINCIANALYMRYCFAILGVKAGVGKTTAETVRKFKEYVRLITYGDDNAMNVHKKADWFNHSSIQSTLATVGITYTMADKEAKSVPFIHIDEVSFLKRYWRWDEDIGAFVCPLEHDSIEKSLMVCVRSSSITPEEQAVQILVAQVTEYFWYGKKTFLEKRALFLQVAQTVGIDFLITKNTFPTWDQLYDRYHHGGKDGSIGAVEFSSEPLGLIQ